MEIQKSLSDQKQEFEENDHKILNKTDSQNLIVAKGDTIHAETIVESGSLSFIPVYSSEKPKDKGEESRTDMTYTSYNIDGWYIQLPQEWKMSLDKEQQPSQIIFDIEDEPVNIYISTWSFERPETGEIASAETISSFMLQTFALNGYEKLDGLSEYYPESFITCLGKGTTTDNSVMITCAVCTEGRAFTFYIACNESVDFEAYLKYIRLLKRD